MPADLLHIYQKLLLDGIVPFWRQHGVDSELGGVLSCMDEHGRQLSSEKYLWSQARWLWVCSALYNRIEKRPEFLEWARGTLDFLLRHGRDESGRWVYRTTREGRIIEGATSIYSDCFVVYGLSEYARAVRDTQYADLAKSIFQTIQGRIEAPDFKETAPYTLPPNRRNHGVPMMMTEVAGELGRTTGDAQIMAAADEHAARVMKYFVRPERQCLLEFLDREYREVPPPEGTFVMPGHAIESMWFVMRRAQARSDFAGITHAGEVMRWHLEKGWDPEYGGIFLGVDAEGQTPFLAHSDVKLWWPHTEALYALLLGYSLTKAAWCREWYQRVHEWSFAHFSMPEVGEWRQRLDRRGQPIETVVALPVKDPFHLSRAVILILELLEKHPHLNHEIPVKSHSSAHAPMLRRPSGQGITGLINPIMKTFTPTPVQTPRQGNLPTPKRGGKVPRLKVSAHILRNRKLDGWSDKIVGRWSYRQLAADPDWYHGWVSFDAVSFNPDDGKIYCGLNSMDGDLLHRFHPDTGEFECLNTRSWADAYDVKIHRTILHNPLDHCLYFATSLLHDLDQQQAAAGGKLVRFDPSNGQYQILGVPAARLYIQSIAADWRRGLLYSFTYPAEAVFKTRIGTGASTLVAWLGNAIMFAQPHNAVVDCDGWLWGTAAETRAWDESIGVTPIRLFKYHPEGDQIVWFEHGLSRWSDSDQLLLSSNGHTPVTQALKETRHQKDFGFCDSMAFDGERYIYAGTVAGVLCRIDTKTGAVQKIANAISTGRFPALALRGSVLYGAGGMHGQTQLIRWDTRTDKLEEFSDLRDPELNERPARIHELAVDADGRVFLGENDNHQRSSYLWSVEFD